MSLEYLHEQVKKFIASPEPEVLCISGPWGVGKTYTWNHLLREAKKKQIGLGSYSYVSLFGIDSLQELKHAIFENTVRTTDITSIPSLKTLNSLIEGAEKFARKGAKLATAVSKTKDYVTAILPFYFLMVRESIVCFDDLERKGENLSIRDVMGLVSFLTEQRRCKLVLILNDDAFEKDEIKDFRLFYEKVVDITLKFEPTPHDSVIIALPNNTKYGQQLKEICSALGISNIRVIRKIERAIKEVEKTVATFDIRIFKQAVTSLSIFGWSIYETQTAPPVSYLENLISNYLKDNKSRTAQEGAWIAALDACRFSSIDDFDRVLLKGMQNGFFDTEELRRKGAALDNQVRMQKQDFSFQQAWRMFHDSFDDNQDQVLNAIYDSFQNAVNQVAPGTLGGTVAIFKELGRPEQAAQMIQHYLSSRANDPEAFNLDQFSPIQKVTDPDVIKAFEGKLSSFKNEKAPLAHLKEMARINGWGEDDLTVLANVPVEEYREIFKTHSGDELSKLVNTCLQFDRFSGGSPEMKEIALRARAALTLIGKENPLNARRVQRYGVQINSQ